MKITYFNQNYILNKKCVMALGCFDGVHKAHRAMILSAKAEADKMALPLVVWTLNVNRPDRLCTEDEKIKYISLCNPDAVISENYDEIRNISAEGFINQLKINYGASHLVCGYNFTFGKNKYGNAANISRLSGKYGLTASVVPEVRDGIDVISSSRIRQALLDGKPEFAEKLLGRYFSLTGEIVHGCGNGRTLGFPTANIRTGSDIILPLNGVYRSETLLNGIDYPSVTNIGIRPTFGGNNELSVETFISGIDSGCNLYGEIIKVSFLCYIRPEKKFGSKEELIRALNRDKMTLCGKGGKF